LNTSDIVSAIEALRARGLEFLSIPDSYYENLRERLASAGMKLAEDLNRLQVVKLKSN
jgi:4-hydroxyphenylpyruvate dioxygenase